MTTHSILNIGTAWRCIVLAMLPLMVLTALVTLAPSQVCFHPASGPLSQGERRNFGLHFAGFFPGMKETEIEVTKISSLDGSLWEWTGVRLDLIHIRSGVAQPAECWERMATNGGRRDHPFYRYWMRPHIVLGEANTKCGCLAVLGSYGALVVRQHGANTCALPTSKCQNGL